MVHIIQKYIYRYNTTHAKKEKLILDFDGYLDIFCIHPF